MITNNISENYDWLIGQWEGIHSQAIYHEEWERVDENELKGRAYMIKKGEIINEEKLKIHSLDSNIFYTAEVSHNPEPVSFRLISETDNTFVFENPAHDFPQKITYKKEGDNSLFAIVEAEKDGKTRKIEYALTRLS